MHTIVVLMQAQFLQPVCHRTHVSKAAMQPFSIVEDLDVVEQILSYIVNCSILSPVSLLRH